MAKTNNKLKELRKQHNYTLDDIEANTGIKRGTYNNYENGKTEPKLETWKKLARFYGVSVPYLQGVERSYSKVTKQTKALIVKALDDCYFYEDDQKWYLSKAQYEIKKYLDHSHLDSSVLNKFNDNYYFWNLNFSFLFSSHFEPSRIVINRANRILSNDVPSENKWRLYDDIAECVNKQDKIKHESAIGKYFSQNYKHDTVLKMNKFIDELYYVNSNIEINSTFDSYIDSIKVLKADLLKDITNREFKLELNKDRELSKNKISKQKNNSKSTNNIASKSFSKIKNFVKGLTPNNNSEFSDQIAMKREELNKEELEIKEVQDMQKDLAKTAKILSERDQELKKLNKRMAENLNKGKANNKKSNNMIIQEKKRN